MSKFTPGPWEWVSDYPPDGDDRAPINILTFRLERNEAHFYGNPELDGANNRSVIHCGEYDVIGGDTPEERVANARLIAAAPDLLEACQFALGYYPGPHTENRDKKLRAAITKATEENTK